jgi:hypothetical protein
MGRKLKIARARRKMHELKMKAVSRAIAPQTHVVGSIRK